MLHCRPNSAWHYGGIPKSDSTISRSTSIVQKIRALRRCYLWRSHQVNGLLFSVKGGGGGTFCELAVQITQNVEEEFGFNFVVIKRNSKEKLFHCLFRRRSIGPLPSCYRTKCRLIRNSERENEIRHCDAIINRDQIWLRVGNVSIAIATTRAR